MNTKIKLFGVGMATLAGLFLGANFASAQTATVATCTSAILNGTLDNTGGSATSVWFDWGTTQSFGYSTQSQVLYSAPQDFSQTIVGLNPGTTYYYRAGFSNTSGVSYSSNILSFTTPTCATQNNNYSQPYVTTNSASSVSTNSATLNGYVTSNGSNVSAWFEWGTNYSFGNTTSYNSYGSTSGTNYNSGIYNLNPNTTYYYRAAAQGSQGVVYGSTLSFTTTGPTYNYNNYSQPYVSTNSASSISANSATLNGYVTASGINVSAWFEWGTTYSLGNTTSYNSYGTGGASFNSGIYNLNPNTTYYYRAAAQSSYGTVYGSTLSFTTSGSSYNYPNYGSAPTVSTLLATELTDSTARLNGLVFASNGQTSNAWYEWGTTASLGYKTQVTNVGAFSTVKHSDYITGLVSGQTYYYRVAAQNSYGTSYGGVNSFVSSATTYAVTPKVTTVNLKPTTVVVASGASVQSLVTLSVEGGADMIGSGEKRTYHVSWKNVSAQSLKNVVLRVVFPKTINVESATKGSFSAADNSVVIDLKTLDPKESGDTFIFGTSARSLKPGELLVVTANMVFTETNGTQGDVVAYLTHTAESAQGGLGASVLNSGDFVPTTLLGWISVMILTLLLVLLGNHLYGRFAEPKH